MLAYSQPCPESKTRLYPSTGIRIDGIVQILWNRARRHSRCTRNLVLFFSFVP